MPDETMRAEFERWAIDQRGESGLPYFIFAREPDGRYIDSSAEHAWKGWQASRASAAPGGEPKKDQWGPERCEHGVRWKNRCDDCDAPPSDAGQRALTDAARGLIAWWDSPHSEHEAFIVANLGTWIDRLRAAISESEGSSNG